jgi:predicted MFS family arabinose efflux permease
MGFAEAVAIPTVQTFVARWVPDAQRSLVLGLVLSGLQVGNVAAYVASPPVLESLNWNGLFLVYGAAGFAWLALWVPVARDNPTSPEECFPDACSVEVSASVASSARMSSVALKSLTPHHSQEIAEQLAVQAEPIQTESVATIVAGMREKLNSVPWDAIFASKEIRAIAVSHSVQNVGLYINLAWLPNYFYTKFDLSVSDSALSAVLPWIGGAVVGSASGFIADTLLQRGVDKTLIRKCAQGIANVVPGVALLGLSVADDLTADGAVAFFVAACASAAACVAGFGSSVQDVCRNPKLASTLYAVTSVPAVLLGSAGVYLTGVVLDATDQNWDLIFRGTAAVYFFGAAYYASQYEAKKLF